MPNSPPARPGGITAQDNILYPFRNEFHQTVIHRMGVAQIRNSTTVHWVVFTRDDESYIETALCPAGQKCPCRKRTARGGYDPEQPEYQRISILEFAAGGFAILHDAGLFAETKND